MNRGLLSSAVISPAPSADPRYPRAAGLLFLALTCFYLLFSGGHIYTPDGVVMYRVTEAMVTRGSVDIEPPPNTRDFGGSWTEDPETGERSFYAWYGLGMSLAATPAYAAGLLLGMNQEPSQLFHTPATADALGAPLTPRPAAWDDEQSYRRLWYDARVTSFPDAFMAFVVSLTNAPITAGAAALLLLIARELGFSLRAGLAASLSAGLATPLWHYAQTFFSEPLAALLWLAFTLFVLLARRRAPLAMLALAGAMVGCLGLTKVALLALAIPAGVLLLWEVRGAPAGDKALRLGAAALGMLPPLGLMLAYNHLRFGSPFATGYGDQVAAWTTPFLEGLYGLLLSPGRGLLLFCPLVLLAIAASPALRRRDAALHDFSWLTLLTLVLLYARWHMWEGGWCWGPRFLVPALPLLALTVAAWVDDPPGRLAAGAGKAVVGLSLLVALSSHMVNFHDYHQWVKRYSQDHPEVLQEIGADHYYALVRWDWRYSPLVRYPTFGVRETMLFPRALVYPGAARVIYLGAALTLLLSAASLSRLRRQQ